MFGQNINEIPVSVDVSVDASMLFSSQYVFWQVVKTLLCRALFPASLLHPSRWWTKQNL